MKVLWFLASCVMLSLYPSPQENAALELAKLEGVWQPTYVEIDGKPYKGDITNDRLVIAGKNYIMTGPKLKMEGLITIDPSKNPRYMDTEVTDGDGKGTKTIGIYELEGTKLTVCYVMVPGERPGEFATKGSSGRALVAYKRVKK